MRVVSNKPNTLRLLDNLSDSILELYYSTPTAKQHATYTNGMIKRNRNKVITCTGENRHKHGKAILKGWREGDFGEEIDGKTVVVSSDPKSPNYREDWKEWFCIHNADLVDILAIKVFEQSADDDAGEDLPDGEDEDKDDTDPS